MLAEWRAEGYDEDAVELWTIGHPGSESAVTWFAGDASSLCAVDATPTEESAYGLYEALQDDLFVIDERLRVAQHVNLVSLDLSQPENRATVDGWVRALLR